ncbi:hypothetical protein J0X20_26980 [Streptomyces sp. KCTC 0041BP]|uniref:hypothetical protein n=1 Tax=Streptomyces sp. KCTC 0041BP TaxID=201500 RepID=UPI001AE72159|nr:hypothetical protein [Streptomyces sp. KCTC 0041BP]MBP0937233.1 hypothetical protein [Streptomyces sp. KCTC 0041BP]
MVDIDPLDQVAVTLLGDLPLWRLRAIEHVTLSRAFWSERDRIIHAHSFEEVMQRCTLQAEELRRVINSIEIEDEKNIKLVLPIAELPKIPILDLEISVDGVPVYRVSKDEAARIQACYVVDLARKARLVPDSFVFPKSFIDFLTFIFYFPPHGYERHAKGFERLGLAKPNYWWARFNYLLSEAGKNELPLRSDMGKWYAGWQKASEDFGQLSRRYVDNDPMSGSQHPVLSIPYLFQELAERAERLGDHSVLVSTDEVADNLGILYGLLEKADVEARVNPHSERFIKTYFSYGYRWMTFARCTVPLDRPFIITMREKRAIYFTPHRHKRPSLMQQFRPSAWQGVSFADAETNHVSIEVSDTDVRIKGRPTVYGETIKLPLDEREEPHFPDEETCTFELYTRVDSQRGRPERIFIKCPLRLMRVRASVLWLTICITAFGWVLLGLRGFPRLKDEPVGIPGLDAHTTANGLTAKDAALILVPVAFAGTLLLSKQDSTLGAWMRKVPHAILLVELFGVLAMAFILVLTHHIKVG